VQARRRDGPDSAGRVGILGKHAHRGEQSAGLGRLKQVGGEHLIDHGAATADEHAPELGVDRVQRRYVHQHIPAPHEVDRAVCDRKLLGAPEGERDAASHIQPAGRMLPGHGNVPRDGVDATHLEAEPLRQLDRLPPLTAAHVEGFRSGTETETETGDDVVEHLRPRGCRLSSSAAPNPSSTRA